MTTDIPHGGLAVDVTRDGTFVVTLILEDRAPTSVKMERMDAIKLMHRISECLMMTEAMQ